MEEIKITSNILFYKLTSEFAPTFLSLIFARLFSLFIFFLPLSLFFLLPLFFVLLYLDDVKQFSFLMHMQISFNCLSFELWHF